MPHPTAALTLAGPMLPRFDEVLTPQALGLVEELHRRFDDRRRELLQLRRLRVEQLAAGGTLDFLPDGDGLRSDPTWLVAPPAPGLEDRRVEITGPPEAKMTINALNSGAQVWMADFEDATSPTWENVVTGQLNLRDALRGTLTFEGSGRTYRLTDERRPTIVVRPRGWHLPEKHVLVDGVPVAGAFVDFALHLVTSGRLALDVGAGPYYYLPKLESHLEARLWNEVFLAAQEAVGLPPGTIRATVLIETLPAAFEMEEILHELREHSAGLNAGRWDYMFSTIKCLRTRGRDFVLPDRNSVTMTVPFMRAYTELLVRTCHRRGAHAIGGMAAFVPSRRDPQVNEVALAKVREDKTREARDGFDGSWVAHPDLVPLCREVFDAVLGDAPDQRSHLRPEVAVTASQLLDVASTPGTVTEAGLRSNIEVGIRYLESWLRGVGAAAIHDLMEDAATAEISRSQVWQWVHTGVPLDGGPVVTRELVEQLVAQEMAAIEREAGPERFAAGRFGQARDVFVEVALSPDYVDFLTLPAYDLLD